MDSDDMCHWAQLSVIYIKTFCLLRQYQHEIFPGNFDVFVDKL